MTTYLAITNMATKSRDLAAMFVGSPAVKRTSVRDAAGPRSG